MRMKVAGRQVRVSLIRASALPFPGNEPDYVAVLKLIGSGAWSSVVKDAIFDYMAGI